MKILLITLICFVLNFNYGLALAQQPNIKKEVLQGDMELIVDVSNMKDTAGQFYFMIAGEGFHPVIMDGKISLRKVLLEPRRCILAFIPNDRIKENPGVELNSIPAATSDIFYFLGIPGKNQVVVNQTMAASKIVGPSVQQLKYISLLKLKDDYPKIFEKEHAKLLTKVATEKVKATKDSLLSIFHSLYQKGEHKYYINTILNFVNANPDAVASLIELEEYSRNRDEKNAELLASLYNNLTYQIKSLPMAELIRKRSTALNLSNTILGTTAPNFTLNNVEGKAISLNDFKGNITLIEFWASWCGPCRAANPGLVEVYQKYNAKGFQILGVTLDNNRDRWLQAIKEDNLGWKHVSDLKNSKNAVAEIYKVAGIPANFLIDRDGKVIATNLEVEQLDDKLKSLLK